MSVFADSAKALIDPLEGPRAFVDARRIVLPLILIAATTAFSGAAFAVRWDAGPSVVRQMQMDGELQKNTEAEITEKIQTTERGRLVGGIAKGVLAMPILILVLAALLKFVGWLLGTPILYVKSLSVTVLSLMPAALFHFIYGISALRQPGLTEQGAEKLVPSNLHAFFPDAAPKLAKLYEALDFFSLWGVVLLGVGFSAATGMKRWKGILLAFILYAAFIGVFRFGLPAMGAAKGGGHP